MCQRVFERNLQGVDDASARQKPASGANSIAWMLGHVAKARTGAVELLGGEPLDDASTLDRYAASVADGYDDGDSLSLEQLVDVLQRSHERLATALDA